ncbi:MAG: hypothetical protein HQ509_09375 [Candidatus Marinimicrobia bacterium]|nr:hypothetical protein [Candidatus Neomarinimicrobiota bacterium]
MKNSIRNILLYLLVMSLGLSQGIENINESEIPDKEVIPDQLIVSDSLVVSKPTVMVVPININIDDSLVNNEFISRMNDIIRTEVIVSGIANLVGEKIEIAAISDSTFRRGVQSDSVANKIGLKQNSTHIISWSLTESKSKYQLTLKAYRLDKIFETSWIRVGMLRYKTTFSTNEDAFELNVKRATWRILGVDPPEDRFPPEPFFTSVIESCKLVMSSGLFFLEVTFGPTAVLVGCSSLVLLGGYGLSSLSSDGAGNQGNGIGFPPDYLEGQ